MALPYAEAFASKYGYITSQTSKFKSANTALLNATDPGYTAEAPALVDITVWSYTDQYLKPCPYLSNSLPAMPVKSV